MSALNRIVNPLRQAAAAFFKHDVALKREPQGLQIVLEARPTERKLNKRDAKAEAIKAREKQELALVVGQLGELLAEYPEARSTLRHLVFVESSVRKKGLKVLPKLPADVLQRALEQLEGLVTNWSPAGLANLRSKMAVAILDHEQADPDAQADDPRTAAVLDNAQPETVLPEPARDAQRAATGLPEEDSSSDDEALAAAYAALGSLAPSGEVELQAELGSRSAKAMTAPLPRVTESAGEIELRVLQD